MRIELRSGEYSALACDLLGYPLFEDDDPDSAELKSLDALAGGSVLRALASGEFKGELHRICLIHDPKKMKATRLLLVGAGKKKEFTAARLRELAGVTARRARLSGCSNAAFVSRGELDAFLSARVCTEGAHYGNYESDLYKTRDREGREVEVFFLVFGRTASINALGEGIRIGTIVGEAVNYTRTLVNEPSNVLTPSRFAELAVSAGGDAGLQVEVLERADMEKLGMNALLAVARGSDEPPKLIVMNLRESRKRRRNGTPHYALIGKGVTFDSGGISIKPSEKMEEMKADMAGGAAVLGAMLAAARLHSRFQVSGLIPAVENLPSGKATRPGDIVRTMHGKTVEIINTDAEGRLILGDAIAYARSLNATHMIDIATLTGACIVALGTVHAGMMGTDQALMDRMRKNSSITGEKVWQLPLDEEYRRQIRSDIADMKNIGNRAAGAITAAKFLQEFVEDVPWVHLDIAGVDLDHEGRPFSAKGATAFGVRTFVQLFL